VRVKHDKPKEFTGDSAYEAREIRAYLKRRGIKANIDVNLRNRCKPKRGRPYRLDKKSYKSIRSAVERFLAWIIAFRRITIRYERLASTYLALIQVARIIIYLRFCDEFKESI